MKKGELHDILYRLTISLSDKNKLYNFFKQFIDLFKGDKIDEKYLPQSDIKLKTINGEDIKGEGDIVIDTGLPTIKAGNGQFSEVFNYQNIQGINNPIATGESSHAEGLATFAFGIRSHAEGYRTNARGNNSHSEGQGTNANGVCTHAEGNQTLAEGGSSHAEGYNTKAVGVASHAEGQYNTGQSNSIHEVGIGTAIDARKDAHRITTDGKHYIPGIGGFTGVETDAEITSKNIKDLVTVINGFETRIAALEAKQTT